MLNFPATTEFNRKIPKQKFYENIDIPNQIKRQFVEKIKGIYWMNKLAPSTVNVQEGQEVKEIEIFKIVLTQQDLDFNVLKLIDKAIPYHIIYQIEYEDRFKICAAYKEIDDKGVCRVISKYYCTEWMSENDFSVSLNGLTMDSVYENFIRQIAGNIIEFRTKDLKSDIERSADKEQIQKEIEKLEKQARSEKQPKKKFEIVAKIRALEDKISEFV